MTERLTTAGEVTSTKYPVAYVDTPLPDNFVPGENTKRYFEKEIPNRDAKAPFWSIVTVDGQRRLMITFSRGEFTKGEITAVVNRATETLKEDIAAKAAKNGTT